MFAGGVNCSQIGYFQLCKIPVILKEQEDTMGKKNAGPRRENGNDRKMRRNFSKAKSKAKIKKREDKEALLAEREAARELDIDIVVDQFMKANVEPTPAKPKKCNPPTARANCSLTAHPEKDELFLFGGEFHGPHSSYVYSDLFVFYPKKGEWKMLVSPYHPPPRCSHQACALAKAGGQLWVFGGEFSSPSGSQFYHYNDLWMFDISSRIWSRIDTPGAPSPRSGHRMVAHKRKLIIFGGFFDNNKRLPAYYNDLHVFDTDSYTWSAVTFPPILRQPCARSGFQMTSLADGILIYGGYSKKKLKGQVEKGYTLSDMWTLKPNPAYTEDDGATTNSGTCAGASASKNSSQKVPQYLWKEVVQHGIKPGEIAGASMAFRSHKEAISFGGSRDDQTDHSIKGQFKYEFYRLAHENHTWHTININENNRLPLQKKGDHHSDLDSVDAQKKSVPNMVGSSDDANISKNNIDIAGPSVPNSNLVCPSSSESESESDDSDGERDVTEKFSSIPIGRMNTCAVVKGSYFYIFGGLTEINDHPVTLNDMWSFDLNKMTNWQLLEALDKSTQDALCDAYDASEDSQTSEEEEESD
eukprot:UC4_evm14s507